MQIARNNKNSKEDFNKKTLFSRNEIPSLVVFVHEWRYKTRRNRSSESGYVVDDGRSDGH